LIKLESHKKFDQKLKQFLLLSCLMGDVFSVWTSEFCPIEQFIQGPYSLRAGSHLGAYARAAKSEYQMAIRRSGVW